MTLLGHKPLCSPTDSAPSQLYTTGNAPPFIFHKNIFEELEYTLNFLFLLNLCVPTSVYYAICHFQKGGTIISLSVYWIPECPVSRAHLCEPENHAHKHVLLTAAAALGPVTASV